MNKLVCSLVLLGCAVSGTAFGAGTAVDVQNARATGMASAVTADSPNASAVFFNPADIIRGRGVLEIQLGDTLIMAKTSFTLAGDGGGTTQGSTPLVPPFQAYLTYGITRDLSVGFGVNQPFGLKVKWPSDWIGNQLIQRATLATYNFNPELAYRFGRLKLGAGVQVMRSTVDLVRAVNFVSSQGQVELAAGAWGVGGNAGLLVDVVPDFLVFGANYRSRVKLNFNNGVAHFTNVPPEFAGTGPGEIHDQSVSTSLMLPDVVALGISLRPMDRLKINADVDYYTWQVFPALTINFEDPTLNQSEPKNWHHTWNYHLGVEVGVTRTIDVRVGAMWDQSPQEDEFRAPDLPDGDRLNLALGVGFHEGGLYIDVGYQYLMFFNTQSTFAPLPGRYDASVNLLNGTIGYRFGSPEKGW